MQVEGPLSNLSEKIAEVVNDLTPQAVAGGSTWYITQYTVWMCVAVIVMLIIVFAAKRREALVPQGRFLNGVEFVVDWIRRDVGQGVIGESYEKHLSLCLTIFFFVLINNLIGLIPGCKPGTGTFSVTFALSLIVFIYFNAWGMKCQGVGHYIVNLAPKGVMFPLNLLVWVIELASLLLRLLTLAVRLFANMFAGHIVLGSFSILTSMFLVYAISNAQYLTALPVIAWFLLLIFMYAMELLVAVIQAYVFMMLTAVYISLASTSH